MGVGVDESAGDDCIAEVEPRPDSARVFPMPKPADPPMPDPDPGILNRCSSDWQQPAGSQESVARDPVCTRRDLPLEGTHVVADSIGSAEWLGVGGTGMAACGASSSSS